MKRLALTLLAASAFALAFPPFDFGFLGWVALVPLFVAARGLRPALALASGALFGFASSLAVFAWVFRFDAFHLHHAVLLGGWLAVFPALLVLVWNRVASDVRALVFVPCAAATLEWLRGHAGFLSFPWATFAQTQHGNLALLQLASVGGEGLVTTFIVAANVAFALLIGRRVRMRGPLSALACTLCAHLFGLMRLAEPEVGESMTVAAIQPSIEPGARSEEAEEAALGRLAESTRCAALAGASLVVWPETAVRDPERDLATKVRIRDVVEETRAIVVFGASETEKLAQPVEPNARNYNSAYLMAPGRSVPEPYRKVRLLPFGEYRPLEGAPSWLAPRVFDTEAGRARNLLTAPRGAGMLRIEPIICWENLFADDLRATASEEPSVIAHLVNDAWFGATAQPRLHTLVSTIRAVESGRPLVVASNAGPSRILDGRGRTLAETTSIFTSDEIHATVQLGRGLTLYRRAGDVVWAFPAFALVLALLRSRAPRASADVWPCRRSARSS